ncbi:hypothetical protein FQN57_004276 [Myotisia sp. PD_48]|nr:hypothetical protein FQN57_004276 [Myotisia sp. PD_48]
MALKLGKWLFLKKILNETPENKQGTEDPYFETVPATNLLGRPTTKRKRKAMPPGLSQKDQKVLTKVKRRAFGDVIDTLLALMVVTSCNKIEGNLPTGLLMHMVFNVFLDFIIGLVPFVGDLADAMYKCNTRNAILLERYLSEGKKVNSLETSNDRTPRQLEEGDGADGGQLHHQPLEPEAVYLPHSQRPRDPPNTQPSHNTHDGQHKNNSHNTGKTRKPRH